MDPVKVATEMESDAIEYYRKAADLTSHPVGKKMFLSIMEDEKRHLAYLQDILKGMDVKPGNVDPMDNVKSVFAEMKGELDKKVKATSDEVEALKVAMGMERKGFEFYKKSAAETKDPKVKALFERLRAEEEKHYRIFSNTHAYIADNANWFMWEQKGIVEG